MTITITDASGNVTEFYNVNYKVVNAIIALLHACENYDSEIISAERNDTE